MQAGGMQAGWQVSADGQRLERRWRVRDFAAAEAIARVAGQVAEARNHHPDVAYGWGWCTVSWTSHDAGGLTGRDHAAAEALDAALAAT